MLPVGQERNALSIVANEQVILEAAVEFPPGVEKFLFYLFPFHLSSLSSGSSKYCVTHGRLCHLFRSGTLTRPGLCGFPRTSLSGNRVNKDRPGSFGALALLRVGTMRDRWDTKEEEAKERVGAIQLGNLAPDPGTDEPGMFTVTPKGRRVVT